MSSTGFRLTNSEVVIGKATIVADTAFDMVDSKARVEELLHVAPYTPELSAVLSKLPVQPPEELVREAITQLKESGNVEDLEKSKLKKWFSDQGINMAFWAQLAIGLASIG
jgi:hypothetical protein